MPNFQTVQLDEARFAEAVPLVRLAIAGIEQDRWLAHCRQMIALGGGVLGAAAEDSALHGVASWRPDEDLRLGRVLRVEMMVALELGVANPVRTALCESLESLCGDLGAVGVALSLPVRDRGRGPAPFPDTWRRAGFRREALFLCKTLRSPPRGPAPGEGVPHLRLVASRDSPA